MAITIFEAITTCCAQSSTFAYDNAEDDLKARWEILPEFEGELQVSRTQIMTEPGLHPETLPEKMCSPEEAKGASEERLPTLLGCRRQRAQSMPEPAMNLEGSLAQMRSPDGANDSTEERLPTLLGGRGQMRGAVHCSDAGQSGKGGCTDDGRTPNLSGDWRLIRVEGDMDGVLKEIGYPWLVRKLFSAASYGIGKTTMHVNQSGHELKVALATEIGTSHWVMISDGEEHELNIGAPEAERCTATARWEGEVHITEPKLLKPRRALPVVRRYIQGQKPHQTLVMEQVTAAGKNAKGIYAPIM
eukprot:TRINITY_DN72447_c0_g1_i1.p1 TRINITY_DN72447_c0_g1~~TRINITY_DN72447_c0_g1_i1.p1  ORF type:complete len:302 (+),score=47.54 TRINITY_DN72447_c0_g1_i1:81-986(+)